MGGGDAAQVLARNTSGNIFPDDSPGLGPCVVNRIGLLGLGFRVYPNPTLVIGNGGTEVTPAGQQGQGRALWKT